MVGVVGWLIIRGRGEVKHRESPEVDISAFFDKQFAMLPR